GDAVGLLHFRLTEHALHLVPVDAVDRLDVHFQVAAVGAVTRVGEPDAALAIDADVVGTVVALALELVRQHRDLARLHIPANDAPPAAGTVLGAFAADEAALSVEGVAVGPAAVGAEDGDSAFGRHLEDAVAGDVAEV